MAKATIKQLNDQSMNEGAMNEGAMNEGAMNEGAMNEGTMNERAVNERDDTDLWRRLLYFMNPFDGRYDDLVKGNWKLNALRDAAAGLIVAMVAIPLAMGFAMASGLRPEQGIGGGAVAGIVGALFGGSKCRPIS